MKGVTGVEEIGAGGITSADECAILTPVVATELTGLTRVEVARRVDEGRVNSSDDTSSRTLWDIIRGNLFTLFNAMLGTALAIVLLVGSPRDAIFGFVVVINLLIGTITEYKSKRTLDKLTILNRSKTTVRRDGDDAFIDSEQIVADDIVVLGLGEQVPADGIVLTSSGLEVDESMLTGESDPIHKVPGHTVLSGSSIVAGSAVYRVTKVGGESYAQSITADAKQFSLVHSELRRSINKILVVISWIIVPIALLLFWSQLRNVGGISHAFEAGQWREAVVQAIAGIIGMVPEGLVLLTSMNFALAALTLARKQVLVQELPAVEVLARVDMLCLDKTGTLTDGTMELVDILSPVVGGGSLAAGAHDNSTLHGQALAVLHAIATGPDANATAAAMAGGLAGISVARVEGLVPFSSARKWSAVTDGTHAWYFGGPDVLLAGNPLWPSLTPAIEEQTATGARVLLLARAPHQPGKDETPTIPAGIEPAALIVLRERIRPDAAEALRYFEEQDVSIKIISGDNPETVAAIATAIGLRPHGAITGIDARELTEDNITEMIRDHQVFGRVTPQQKRSLVHELQAQGHTVAMTGDGVNDALALKDADLGIAMGTGAPATKAVARIILLDGKFSSLPAVVGEGRRVIANMERVATLFLTKTTYAVLLAVVVAMVAWPYPYLPRHFTLVGAFTIGTPAFFLALAPNNRRYRPGFLRRVLWYAIPCGIIAGVGVLAAYGPLHAVESELQASTAATMVLIIVGLWLLSALARPWTNWRRFLIALMVSGAVLAFVIPPVRQFFALEIPAWGTLVLVGAVGAVAAGLVEVVYRFRKWFLARRYGTNEPDAPSVEPGHRLSV